jgi:hypothetical protein
MGKVGKESYASFFAVMPAKAGIQGKRRGLQPWIPAFAGMTNERDAIEISMRNPGNR